MKNQPTNQEIMDAIGVTRADLMTAINGNRAEIGDLKTDMTDMKTSMQAFSRKMDDRFDTIEKTMVTKTQFSYGLAELRGKMLHNQKCLNQKTLAIVFKLKDRKVLSPNEANTINSMQPIFN